MSPTSVWQVSVFALKTWLADETLRQKDANQRGNDCQLQNIKGQESFCFAFAFGILVSRFRVMLTTIELPPETEREVVFTCVVLHNILRSKYQGQDGGQQLGDDYDDVPGDCRLIGGAVGGGPDRNIDTEAKRQRDYLKDYFNNEGAVAWQDGKI